MPVSSEASSSTLLQQRLLQSATERYVVCACQEQGVAMHADARGSCNDILLTCLPRILATDLTTGIVPA